MLIQVYSRSVPKEGRDELSALNLILQDTATEIIDIASIEHTQGVEQADYNEKAAHYSKRLAQVSVVKKKLNLKLSLADAQGWGSTGGEAFNPTFSYAGSSLCRPTGENDVIGAYCSGTTREWCL